MMMDKGINNSIVQVDSDTYALAYRGTGSAGFISTFNISSDGTTITKVHTIEHDTEFAWDNSLIKVDSDTFALAYGGDNGGFGRPAGFISTFTIDSDGTITPIRIQNHAAFASASANLEHDTNEGSVNSLVHVNDDTYALSYERNGSFSRWNYHFYDFIRWCYHNGIRYFESGCDELQRQTTSISS